MQGKSSAFILRQVHPDAIEIAKAYDKKVDFPSLFSSLSLRKDSVPYHIQIENANNKK